MITIYHLSTSRSERIVWLMEELGEPYELVKFQRVNMRSPPEMKEIHVLNKSPTVKVDGQVMIESGAIVEYIAEKFGRLAPPPGSADRARYLQWMHFSEGSLLPVLFQTLRAAGGFGGQPTGDLELARRNSDRYLDFVEAELAGRPYFAGQEFTAADIMMMYCLRFLERITDIERYPNIRAYRRRIAERPAFKKGMEIANPPVAQPA